MQVLPVIKRAAKSNWGVGVDKRVVGWENLDIYTTKSKMYLEKNTLGF